MLGNECFAIQYYRMKNMFIMLLAMLCVVSAYAQDFEVDGLSYQVTKSPDGESPGEVEVTGGEIKEEIEFPETVTYNSATYMVTSIGSNAFSGRSNSGNFTKKYIIPGTVRSIGNSAFYDNYYLEEVEFNEGLQTIGAAAFGYNFALKEIRIPSTVTAIENGAFRTNRQNQATISCLAATPPANLGSETFQGRTDATLHVVAANVEAYQEAEYWKDFSVISGVIRCFSPVITCDNNILTISCKTEGAAIYYTTDGSVPDENAIRYTSPISYTTNQIIRAIAIAEGYESSSVKNFYDKEQVEQITDEQGVIYTLNVTDFSYSVTGHSDELNAEIVIPSALGGCPVRAIGNTVFKGCTALSSVTISNGVTTIGHQAFYGCTSLSAITIPNSVTSIGGGAFSDCHMSNESKVISEITTPFTVDVFWLSLNATLVVPKGSRTDYKSTDGWGFAIIYEDGETIYDRTQTDEQGVKYTLMQADDGSVYYSVTGHSDELSTEIVIPSALDGCPVRTIKESAFYGCNDFTTITIPNSVTSIGEHAFAQCRGISAITISTSVSTISDESFWACDLKDVTLVVMDDSEFCNNHIVARFDCPIHLMDTDGNEITEYIISDDVTTISESAFANCRDLTSVTIPNSVTSIGNSAFKNCDGLTTITIPNSVTSIGDDAFSGCSGLTSVKLGKKVTTIGRGAFNDCSNLSSINTPNSLVTIGGWALRGCAFTSITIPNSVTSIGEAAFANNSNLSTVILGEGITEIEESTFANCKSLSSIIIPDGVKSIGRHAFHDCGLTSIAIPNSVTSIGGYAFQNNSNLTTVILGDGITEIEEVTFENCIALSSIIIPNEVATIGSHAFGGCRSLASIKLPESLTSLGERVFDGCPLKSIELPNPFTVIPENLFSNNDFQYIKLGNNVKSIGKSAFGSYEPVLEIGTSTPPSIASDAFPNVEYLSDLTVIVPNAKAETAYRKKAVWEEMTFSNQNNISEVTVDTPGDLSFELITECNMMPAKVVGLKVNGTINADDFTQMLVNMKSLLRLDLSDCDITEIPDEALSGKTQLKELTLPTNLQAIGANAFHDCPYLTGELVIPSTVTSIGDYAFEGTDYSSVKLPNALKTIGNYAFNNLPLEQRLVLPGKVTSVGTGAFAGTKITGLSIPDGVKSIGAHAFADTPIQGHLTIPDGVTDLGEGAFMNTQISTAFLPNSVTTLSQGLFQGCSNLNLLYIPDNYTDMSNYALDGCDALETLRLSANTATMGEYSFQGTPLEYIKVPSKVEVLSRGMLKNCKNLASLSLPANLKSLEAEALTGCTALRNISVEALTPPTIKDRSVLRGINTDLCLISIPTQSYRDYALAPYWGQFVQMRNDIAVETVGNGEIAFESVVEEEEEDVVYEAPVRADVRRVAAFGIRRAPQLASKEDAMTYANNGSSIYAPQDAKVLLHITPDEGEELISATLDGEDIMPFIVNGIYTATADKKNAKLVVEFSGQSVLAGDVNSDGNINVTDVGMVIDHILEHTPSGFVEAAADLNNDGDVNVTDVGLIIEIILSDGTSSKQNKKINAVDMLDPQ